MKARLVDFIDCVRSIENTFDEISEILVGDRSLSNDSEAMIQHIATLKALSLEEPGLAFNINALIRHVRQSNSAQKKQRDTRSSGKAKRAKKPRSRRE